MPFFTDYGNYMHGSAPFSSQYYSQLLPYPGSSPGGRSAPRVHMARNYNSIAVEQTLRAIRRSPGAVAARHYARPVHVNTSEIDVTSPRRPRRTAATETTADVGGGIGGNDGVSSSGSVIHRGRTVVRLHTNKNNNKRSVVKPADSRPEPVAAVETAGPPALPSEEGLAKKGTIKRHTSAGVKVPVNDDRRPSVTDEILREQEALFDTMIMEEMEGQEKRVRRKSYPVDMGGGGGEGGKQPHRTRETRKKSVAPAMMYCEHASKPAKSKAGNWKLNYDVIIEESGIEPVSFTFKLNNTTKKESDSRSGDNGKLDANHNVVISKSHDNDNDNDKKNNSNKKHAKTLINKNQCNNDNSEGGVVGEPVKKTKVVKKKIIVKKKVVKKKKKEGEEETAKEEQSENRQDKQELQKKKILSPQQKKTLSPQKKKTPSPQKKECSTNAVAVSAVITPFVRASFGKTFISPSQVSSTKSKFEKPKPKINLETPPSPPPPPAPKTPLTADDGSSSDDDESSSEDDTSSSSSSSSSSLCSGSSGSTFYDSDDYDSSSSSDTATNSYQIGGGASNAEGTERSLRSYSYRHHSRPKRVVPPATSIPRFRKYAVDDFNFLKVLGKGSFGKVLLAELKGTDYYYAVKCLKKDVVLEDDDVECTLIERKVLALGTNHPYLCHLFCTFQTESHLFFVMEYLNGGDLMFHIQQSGRFDEGRSRFYASEIVSGLKFLHKKGIVYRDLKLDNILLDFNGHVRIADFGMCKLQIYLDKTADTFCGTPDYMAPEIIKGQKYNQSVDWWSFGILLYEMLVGKSPFSGCDEDALFWSICNEQPQYPRYLSVDSKSVLVALLDKDASKRLGSLEANHSAEDVIRHPFFSSMDWCKLERRELEPPYMPRVYHPLDTHYFDKHFTKEKPRLTPVDKTILQSMDQSQFDGFTYTNPNVTDS
ncbi:serine/threonine-protein kinase N isoform X2 [Rhopalosiphum maidis]|uniref:serine/threonine-protein kinase N isoform X2 n=1 Tax=Rhopalosiphum maidis TaxID=43146 RepID=UPI000EFE0064|nr:serine/threonine-protein kinase N isoform X2 [Rhopalosiphum maidis]